MRGISIPQGHPGFCETLHFCIGGLFSCQTIPANQLLAGLTLAEPVTIRAVVTDSRKVEPGCVSWFAKTGVFRVPGQFPLPRFARQSFYVRTGTVC